MGVASAIRRVTLGGLLLLALAVVLVTAFFFLAPLQGQAPPPAAGADVVHLGERDAFRLLGESAEDDSRPGELRSDLLIPGSVPPVVLASSTLRIVQDPSRPGGPSGGDFVLSGSPEGDQGWHIEGLLLLETFAGDSVHSRAVVGDVEWITASNGTLITRLGRRASRFASGELNVTSLLPDLPEARLRVSALSRNGGGVHSALFLVRETR
jgi:hypothetical protein